MSKEQNKTLLERLILRLKGNKKPVQVKKTRAFGRNTAILNDTPKNHKPGKGKIVQK